MAGRFHRVLCAIPGVLALVGCWWLCCQRRKSATFNQEERAAEEQQETPAASVEVREAASKEEQCPGDEASASLPLEMASVASSGCARASEGGTSAKAPPQKTRWSGASGQQLDSQRVSASQDVPAEQSSAPRKKPPTLALPEGSIMPHSKGVHKQDALALHRDGSRAAGMGEGPSGVGRICAAPALDGAWLRAQVNRYFEETGEVELCYVDYGGYDRVKIHQLRKIRSDFLSLPFQAAEVLLDNVVPLADEDHFSSQADAAMVEMTRGAVLLAQVTNYDSATGLPLVEL